MKKILFAIIACAVMSLTALGSSLFDDVKESDWFYKGVACAKQSGLMNGVSDTLFAPKDTLSVAQAVTVAARIHSLYNGNTIPQEFQGYDYYMNYATEKGIVYDGYFEDTKRPIKRSELAYILSECLDEKQLSPKNDTKFIPDADYGSEYYEGLLRLYNAGIFGGFDEYGAFLPDNNLTRAELSVVLDRVLNTENRLTQTVKDGTNREAFYLIDDFLMANAARSIPEVASGWLYDNTGSSDINSMSAFQNVLDDRKTDDNLSMKRNIYPQFTGKVTLEVIYEILSGNDGFCMYFSDKDQNKVFEIFTKDGFVFVKGDGEKNTGVKSEKGRATVKVLLDLDNKKALVYINGSFAGEYDTAKDFDGIFSFDVATTDKDTVKVRVDCVHLYKNFAVNDLFRMEKVGSKPCDYTVTENVTVEKIVSNEERANDLQSVRMSAEAEKSSSAYRKFDKMSGKFSVEAFILMPKGENGTFFALRNGEDCVVKLESKDGYFAVGDKKLSKFYANVWQNIQITADTDKKVCVIKINGKTVGENIAFDADGADGLEISYSPSEKGEIWFDDVVVKPVFEYNDYVPQPKVLETDYILSMMVCSLWRNGSHYGWQYIAPFEEITPVTGYYDEGNPEAMDWEIKFLTEHGFSDYHLCWYVPNSKATSPIKKPRMVDALHGGYFNAKYSDLMNFSIMWENAGYTDTNLENFKEYVWKYWCQWYFTDDRYLKIDGKPFLSIYHVTHFYKMCGNNSTTAKELINWMRADIKNYGFDDIIIAFSSSGRLKNENEILKNMGIDTLHNYAWGSAAGILSVNKTMVDEGYKTAQSYGLDTVAVASPGLTSFAWNMPRTEYLNASDYEKLLVWMRDDYLKRFDENSYLSKLVMFDNWNEFGEGHYLYPASIEGFGYLDAAAKVFGKDGGFDDSVNTVPTTAQKRRIGTLFPALHTHLKRENKIKQKAVLPEKALRSFDFTKKEVCDTFTTSNMINYGYNDSEKAFTFEAKTSDPIMWYGKQTDRKTVVNADETDVIHIRMKSPTPSQGQLFFVTDLDSTWDEAKSFKFQITETDRYVDYYIDAKDNRKWKGQIFGIRLDPHAVSGQTAAVTHLEFMQYAETERVFEIVIDGTSVSMQRDEVREYDGDEMYLCFKHESGIFQLLCASYKWNRHTRVLEIDTKYGTTFVFTVGSDRAMVDGKEAKLDKKVEMYDGTVVLPVLFILENGGYDYIYASDKSKLTVNVNVSGIERIDGDKITVAAQNGKFKAVFPIKNNSVYMLDFDAKLSDNTEDLLDITFFDGKEKISAKCQDVTTKDGFAHFTAEFSTDEKTLSDGCYVTVSKDGKSVEVKSFTVHRKNAAFTLKNGNAEGEDTTAFYSSGPNNNTVKVVDDPHKDGNKIWQVKNINTEDKSWSYIRQAASYSKGMTYEVEFDVRIVALSDGRPVSGANVIINPRYYDTVREGQKNPHDHNVVAVKNLPTSTEWTHIKKSFIISDGFEDRPTVQQEFSIYVEPVDGLGVSFEIDNFVLR